MNDFVGSFGIQGEIEVPDGVDFDTFCNKFMEAMKILGWRFCGFFEDGWSAKLSATDEEETDHGEETTLP